MIATGRHPLKKPGYLLEITPTKVKNNIHFRTNYMVVVKILKELAAKILVND
jgi:hypothetical protein